MEQEAVDLSKVVFRPLRKEDYEDLIAIGRTSVKEALERHPDKLSRDVIACDFVKSLNNSNYCEVAEYNGRPVGVLMGRCDSNFNEAFDISRQFGDLRTHFNLMLKKSGRKMLRHLSEFDQYDEELSMSTETDYDGELVYFNLREDLYKDSDVGYALFEHFRNFMRENGASNFYLLVHSEGKREFFQHNYFKLVRTRMFDHDGMMVTIYLYEYNVENPVKENVINYVKSLYPDIDINLISKKS